jgi:hypothetical protein
MRTSLPSDWVKWLFSALLATTVTLVVAEAAPAGASGSPSSWQNAQVGLTYPIYRPSVTLGMGQTSFQLLQCVPGKDESVYATYGAAYTPAANFGKKSGFSIGEGYPAICANGGAVMAVGTRTEKGITIEVSVYCDAAHIKSCTLGSGVNNGYVLQWRQPYKPPQALKERTQMYLDTSRLTLAQALSIAGGLKPA